MLAPSRFPPFPLSLSLSLLLSAKNHLWALLSGRNRRQNEENERAGGRARAARCSPSLRWTEIRGRARGLGRRRRRRRREQRPAFSLHQVSFDRRSRRVKPSVYPVCASFPCVIYCVEFDSKLLECSVPIPIQNAGYKFSVYPAGMGE